MPVEVEPPVCAYETAAARRKHHDPDPLSPEHCATCRQPRPCPGLDAITAAMTEQGDQ